MSWLRPPRLLLWVALLIPGAASAQDGATQARPEITDIHFEGNAAFHADTLAQAIVNRETSCRTIIFKILPLCPLGVGFAFDRRYFEPSELPRDVVRLELFHWVHGYREADVSVGMTRDTTANEVAITFQVDEGRPVLVDTILFLGDDVPEPSYLAELPLSSGDPLSGILMDATRDTIQARLRNNGYARAEVLRSFFIPSGTYEAEVEFDIYTGPLARFGNIDVRWTGENRSLSRESVLRFLPFQEGDVYSREGILRAQRSLFGVGLIQSARIQEDTLAEVPDTLVPLSVVISEGDLHRVGVGVGWSTADCLNGEARWASRNFMGGARRLTVRGRVSNVLAPTLNDTACPEAGEGEFSRLDWLGSVELVQPWIFGTRNSLSASVFGERTSIPDVFVRTAVGARVGLARNIARGTSASLTYRPELSRLSAAEIFFCTSFLVCDPGDIDVLQSANWLAPVGLSLNRDGTDNLLNPSRGYRALLDLEHASGPTGSNFRYDRAVIEASLYHPLARRTVLAGRLRGGWIGDGSFQSDERSVSVVHPQKRFYAGGASSVRGFAQGRLGPRVLTTDVSNLIGFREVDEGVFERVCEPTEVAVGSCVPSLLSDGAFFPRPTGGTRLVEGNVEYRFAWGSSLQGVAFLDFGQVWRDGSSLDLSELELSPGVGVRYFSPVGPIRIDLGYRFRGAEELGVVTSGIAPFGPGDDPEDRICIEAFGQIEEIADDGCDGDLVAIPWVRLRSLTVLREPYLYGEGRGFFQNLQLHFSIGQAF